MNIEEIISISSVLGSTFIVFSLLYFLYDYILTHLFRLENIVIFKVLYLSDIISIMLSFLTIIHFVTIKPIN